MEITSFSGFLGKNFSKTVTAFLANYIRYAIINTYSYLDIDIRIQWGERMDTAAQERFLKIVALAAQDETYQKLQRRCAELDLPFLSAMERLSEEERNVVMAYIRAMGTSALRLLEIACEA